ncbi:MAG TPA: glutamine synthetase, partial [Gemmatimonadales bacterium]
MPGPTERSSSIDLRELESRIRNRSIDTVISAFTDLQGRLMGKRVTGDFFLDHAREGTHVCTYLLGTDMEMRTPSGYRLMSWETGYGDY